MTRPKRPFTTTKPDGTTIENITAALLALRDGVEPDLASRWANAIGLIAYLERKGPTATRVSLKTCIVELEALAKSSWIFVDALNKLHAPAEMAVAAALGDRRRFADFQYDQIRKAKAIYTARDTLRRAEAWPSPPSLNPTDRAAGKITSAVADAFLEVTGRRPTISTRDGRATGPFIQFLGLVFFEVGHKASAETFARKWIRDLKAKEKRDMEKCP